MLAQEGPHGLRVLRADGVAAGELFEQDRVAGLVQAVAVGARGVISVSSNAYPAEVTKTTRLALDGKFEEARREHLALCGVHEAMFVEANPSPVKAVLAHHGRMKDVVRGPLARISDAARTKVLAAVKTYEGR